VSSKPRTTLSQPIMATALAITIISLVNQPPEAFETEWAELRDNYDVVSEFSMRLHVDRFCVDYVWGLETSISLQEARREFYLMGLRHDLDICVQIPGVYRRQKRLVIFDMDSTLIQQECINELAAIAGVGDRVVQVTEAAMRGETDFAGSFRQRVKYLRGQPTSIMEEVRRKITFSKGARELCRALKRLGFKLAVVSGGFVPIAEHVKNELQLDYAFANDLAISTEGKFTGEVMGPIVDGQRKGDLLELIAQLEGIPLYQAMAVGDGANDLVMMSKASLGIAFQAKPAVQERAVARINTGDLQDILYLLRFSDHEQVELVSTLPVQLE